MVDISTSHFLTAPRGFASNINRSPRLNDFHIHGNDNEYQGKDNKKEKRKKKKNRSPDINRNPIPAGLECNGADGESEETDADDEDDDEDDNESDNPAVLSPVRVKSSSYCDEIDRHLEACGLSSDPFEHRTGLQDDVVFKTPMQQSKSDEISIVDSIDDLDSFDEDLFDEEIEKEEEMAIIKELEDSDVGISRTRTMTPTEEDINILSDIEFDEELAQDPDILWSISRAHFGDFGLYGLDFPPPAGNPRTPPASPTAYGVKLSREAGEYFTDSASETETDMEMIEQLPANPTLALTTEIAFNWDDSEDSDEDNVWEAGSAHSTDNEKDNEESGDEADAESDADATEDEAELPTPLPRNQSVICRPCDLPAPRGRGKAVSRPATIKARPIEGCWLADGSRPICVIDGTNKTYIVPGGVRPGESDEDADEEIDDVFDINALLVSDATQQFLDMDFQNGLLDPALSGLFSNNGGFMNGNQTIGAPEAFFPYLNGNGGDAQFEDDFSDVLEEYLKDNEEEEDEEESHRPEVKDLDIDQFLNVSSGDDDEEMSDASDDHERRSSTSSTGHPHVETEAEIMLSRWDQVSVTAFRKRQIQHHLRIQQKTCNSPTPGHRLITKQQTKLIGPDLAMSPIRKRRLRKRVVSVSGTAPKISF